MTNLDKARVLLKQFKGDSYLFGTGVLSRVGEVTTSLGKNIIIVHDTFKGSENFVQVISDSLSRTQVKLISKISGAAPNCPRKDLYRIMNALKDSDSDVIMSFGGGSTIDAVKAAEVLRTLGGEIDDYFGTGLVSKVLQERGKRLTSHLSIQTAASSAAHLTKYANITDTSTGQKKLIVDDAIVPGYPVFDYEVTYNAPVSLTIDGAIDGIAHCLEVLYGAVGGDHYDNIAEAARTGIALVVEYLPRIIDDPTDIKAREGLCLATDLGGYCIMIGGTNGGHLTSFSLVDILSHGRACGMMNPYYTVLFAPAIEKPLRLIGKIYQEAGFTKSDIQNLSGRELGIAVAEAMLAFSNKVGLPTTLDEIEGFSPAHIERALTAAKNPQLRMKLQNMPVPLTAEMVDEYMGPVLEAARSGNLSIIKNV